MTDGTRQVARLWAYKYEPTAATFDALFCYLRYFLKFLAFAQ
jgi:hypothetical protein